MTSTNNLLNFQFHQVKQAINQPTLVFIHGLFGDMNNLSVIARHFMDRYSTLRLDLRNHGQSFHSNEMNYDLMAQDVANIFTHLQIDKAIVIGHSMGGKTAMKFTALFPQWVEKLVVIDIAPVAYSPQSQDPAFNGLWAVKTAQAENRQQAQQIMANFIPDIAVQQFLLKGFSLQSADRFRFNLTALKQNYPQLANWQACYSEVPTLFIRGGKSHYIQAEHKETVLNQFPNATSFTINGAGHWVHGEKPEFVIRAIERFLIAKPQFDS